MKLAPARRLAAIALLTLFGAGYAVADDNSDPRVEIGLSAARQFCADQDTGLNVEPSAFFHVDLTGDQIDELVIDERGVACDGAMADPRDQGSAGTRIVIVVGDKAFRFVAREWYVLDRLKSMRQESNPVSPPIQVPLSPPRIVLVESGIACGGAGFENCMSILSWEPETGRFNEVMTSSAE